MKKIVVYNKLLTCSFSYVKFRNRVTTLFLKQFAQVPNLFVNSIKLINNVFFNKTYLLLTNKLRMLKKFNLFFSSINFFCPDFKKVKRLTRSKQIFIYLRYLVCLKKDKRVLVKPSYRKKRNYYLNSYFKDVKFKRFFFYNLTLAFFWKKRTCDFIYSAVLKKYRVFFFFNYKNFLCSSEKHIFNYYFLFKAISDKVLNKKYIQTVFIYKQISSFFFKYKYYLYLKKNNSVTSYFIYNNNYLSWNFLYFWYWYFIAFLFKKSILVTHKSSITDSFSTIISDLNFCSFSKLGLLNSKKLTNKVHLNLIFQILFKYILLKNSNTYNKLCVTTQIFKWKKQFIIYKKFYRKFLNKFKKRFLVFKRKIRKKKIN